MDGFDELYGLNIRRLILEEHSKLSGLNMTQKIEIIHLNYENRLLNKQLDELEKRTGKKRKTVFVESGW